MGTLFSRSKFNHTIFSENNNKISNNNWCWLEQFSNYAPSGLPDFDLRQNEWKTLYPGPNEIIESTPRGDDSYNQAENCIVPGPNCRLETLPQGDDFCDWSFEGPVSIANCFWWLDSRFSDKTGYPGDGEDIYPLVKDYGTGDDHSIENVQKLIEKIANEVQTSSLGKTYITNIESGIQSWLEEAGLTNDINVNLINNPNYVNITDNICNQNNIIIKLGFYKSELLEDQKQIHSNRMLPIKFEWPGHIQSFITTSSALNSLQLLLVGAENNWTDVTISIYDIIPENASVTPIGTSSRIINPSAKPEWIKFLFYPEVSLIPGNEYYISVRALEESPYNIHWCYGNDIYQNGIATRCHNNYILEELYDNDFAFKTEYYASEGTRCNEQYVAIAGINPENQKIALSDPYRDWNYTENTTDHNDALYVSHDIYKVKIGKPLTNVDCECWIEDYISPGLGDYTIVEQAIFLQNDILPPEVKVQKPDNWIYLNDKKIIPFIMPLIIGKITIEVYAVDNQSGIERVEIYIGEDLAANLTPPPDEDDLYKYLWKERIKSNFIRKITVIAYDNSKNMATDEIYVVKIL
jgi:hypothetical protein